MAVNIEIVFVFIFSLVGSLNTQVFAEELENSNELTKPEKLASLQILLSLTNFGGQLPKEMKDDLSQLLQESLNLSSTTMKNLEILGPFLKMSLSLINDIRGETIFSNIKYDRLHNIVLVFIIYDFLDQILNELHEDNFLTIPIGHGKPKTCAQNKLRKHLWTIISHVLYIPGEDLDNFYDGTSVEVERRTMGLKKFRDEFIDSIKNHMSH